MTKTKGRIIDSRQRRTAVHPLNPCPIGWSIIWYSEAASKSDNMSDDDDKNNNNNNGRDKDNRNSDSHSPFIHKSPKLSIHRSQSPITLSTVGRRPRFSSRRFSVSAFQTTRRVCRCYLHTDRHTDTHIFAFPPVCPLTHDLARVTGPSARGVTGGHSPGTSVVRVDLCI